MRLFRSIQCKFKSIDDPSFLPLLSIRLDKPQFERTPRKSTFSLEVPTFGHVRMIGRHTSSLCYAASMLELCYFSSRQPCRTVPGRSVCWVCNLTRGQHSILLVAAIVLLHELMRNWRGSCKLEKCEERRGYPRTVVENDFHTPRCDLCVLLRQRLRSRHEGQRLQSINLAGRI